MANFKLLLSHTKKFEGGHSADPRDNALKTGHSGVLGKTINPVTKKPYDARFPNNFIHTNAGVIWSTYVAYCIKKKIPATAQGFLQMSEKTWEDIFKVLFWDTIKGDKINSQGVAEQLMEAIWGGGSSVLIRDLYNYMNKNYKLNLQVKDFVDNNLVNALNTNINTKKRYDDLMLFMYNSRINWLKTLSDWRIYGRGWTNRMNELYKRVIKYPFAIMSLSWYFKLFGIAAAFFF